MKCPSCKENINKKDQRCANCGLLAPGIDYFINSGSFSKWDNQINQLRATPKADILSSQENSNKSSDDISNLEQESLPKQSSDEDRGMNVCVAIVAVIALLLIILFICKDVIIF